MLAIICLNITIRFVSDFEHRMSDCLSSSQWLSSHIVKLIVVTVQMLYVEEEYCTETRKGGKNAILYLVGSVLYLNPVAHGKGWDLGLVVQTQV